MKNDYSLEGVNGNVFAIIGYTKNAMRECKCTREEIDKYVSDCKNSDNYYNVIFLSQSILEKLNADEA